VLSIIGVAYSGEDRVRALTVYGMVMGLAAVGGQLIGGVLVQADIAGLGWRTCFLINVPIGAAALVAAPRLVSESRAGDETGLDLLGTALVTLGLAALVLPLVEGRQHGWPAWTWLSLAAAPAVFVVFALQQRRLARSGGTPLLDPELFRERSFSAGLLTQFVFWGGQASFFLVLALYLQQGRGLDALQAGLVFTILAVAYLASSLRAPELVMRHGRRVLGAGALVLATGHVALLAAVLAVGVGGSVAVLVPGLLLVGAGMGMVIAPLATTIMSTLEPERAGAASGMLSTMQNVGNALGVAITGVIFFGALHGGYAHAFRLALVELALLLVAVGALTRLLPAHRHGSHAATRDVPAHSHNDYLAGNG
jgi:MFS family permease